MLYFRMSAGTDNGNFGASVLEDQCTYKKQGVSLPLQLLHLADLAFHMREWHWPFDGDGPAKCTHFDKLLTWSSERLALHTKTI